MDETNKKDTCFLILPGFAPDAVPVLGIQKHLEDIGYSAVATNFWGNFPLKSFSHLSVENCKEGIARQVDELRNRYTQIIGIGISLGGALLLEYAKENSKLDAIISVGAPFKLKKKFLIKLGFALYPLLYIYWKMLGIRKSSRPIPIPAASMIFRYLNTDFLKNLEDISTPTLLLHSKKDYLSDYRAVDIFFEKMKMVKKQVIYLNDASHVLDYDGSLIFETASSFVKDAYPKSEKMHQELTMGRIT